MINFKLLLLISFCFILTKVIGSNEKYSNNTVNDNKLKTNIKSDDKSNKLIKKNDKLKFRDEKFQVLKAGSDLQLQKNSMQNSFQSVYDQAFIIDNPIDQVTKITNGIKNKINTKFPTKPTSTPKPFELPKIPILPIKPIITNKEQPLYHFNKKPIVFQCCRYVFPSDMYGDHLMFYSKFGHTYSNENNDNKSLNPINHLSNQLLPNDDKKEFIEKETLINVDKQNNNEETKFNDKLMNGKYEKEDEKIEDKSDKLEKIEKLDAGDSNEKSNKLNEKLNTKSDDKLMEPDEAATNLFKIWNTNSNSKNLYNFGSCVPIYDLSQTNLNFNPSHQARSFRWPFFG